MEQNKVQQDKAKAFILRWDKENQWEEKSPKIKQKNQRPTSSHFQESHRSTKKDNSHITYTEDLVQIHIYPMLATSVSESQFSPHLIDSVDQVFLMLFAPSGIENLSYISSIDGVFPPLRESTHGRLPLQTLTHIISDLKSVYLLSSAIKRSLSDDDWTRHSSMSKVK